MKINFEALASAREVTVPIKDKTFRFENRYYSTSAEDGWWKVRIKGNSAEAIEETIPAISEIDLVRGYTYNNNIVFENFDVAKRKWKAGLQCELNLNRAGSFEYVRAAVWENKRVYFVEALYGYPLVMDLKLMCDEGLTLEHAKGVTPELRTVYLFHALEKESQRKIAEETKKKEDHERMMRDIPYRLAMTFQRSGAELVRHQLTGSRIICDWKIPGSEFEYNSVIDSRTWMVVEAGYCMSHDDKRHNITSMVKTAEDYEDRGLTYITRS
jgi:hypothetical protein